MSTTSPISTPQKITTTSGAVVWSAIYDAFGNSRITVEAITSHLRFAGQYLDAETGLCYNLNRYYDPATGRYLQPDPAGQGLNLYTYVFNNPTGLIDPLGLCAVRAVGKGVKKSWNWLSGVAVTSWVFWKGKHQETWKWWSDSVTVNFDPFIDVTNEIYKGIGKAGLGTWNAFAYNKDLHRGVIFGFRAAMVVTEETTKIVAQDVALSLVKVPLTPAGSFAFSKSVGLILLPVNVVKAGDNTRNLSKRIQENQHNVIGIR